MMDIRIIAGVTANMGLGFQGGIPWLHPADMQVFKRLTTGHTVVMGRRTYDSIGRPLPNRRTVVISSTAVDHPGVETVSLPMWSSLKLSGQVWIAGGRDVYRAFLPDCRELCLTHFNIIVPADVYFPAVDFQEWQSIESSRLADGIMFSRYRRAEA